MPGGSFDTGLSFGVPFGGSLGSPKFVISRPLPLLFGSLGQSSGFGAGFSTGGSSTGVSFKGSLPPLFGSVGCFSGSFGAGPSPGSSFAGFLTSLSGDVGFSPSGDFGFSPSGGASTFVSVSKISLSSSGSLGQSLKNCSAVIRSSCSGGRRTGLIGALGTSGTGLWTMPGSLPRET